MLDIDIHSTTVLVGMPRNYKTHISPTKIITKHLAEVQPWRMYISRHLAKSSLFSHSPENGIFIIDEDAIEGAIAKFIIESPLYDPVNSIKKGFQGKQGPQLVVGSETIYRMFSPLVRTMYWYT